MTNSHTTEPKAGIEERTPLLPNGVLWAGAAVVVLALAVAAWVFSRGADRPEVAGSDPAEKISAKGEVVSLTSDAPQWKFVDLQVAKEGPALAPLPSPGHVAFDELRTSAVGTPLAGRIEVVAVRLGDRVRAGTRLFAVRSGALADVARDVENSQRAVSVKQRLAQRTKELVELHTAPEKDLIAAEAEVREAETALKTAVSRRESLQISAEGTNLFWVTAPREGTIVELGVSTGQEVTSERENPLIRVADLNEVIVIADVQERDVMDLRVGEPVTIHARSGLVSRPGEVTQISDVVDPTRRTVQVRVRAKNFDRALRPNAFVEVELPPGEDNRVRVPSEAVVTDGSRAVVFLAREDGRLVRTPVTIGRERDGQVEIVAGLPVGQRFVARGALLVLNQIDLVQ